MERQPDGRTRRAVRHRRTLLIFPISWQDAGSGVFTLDEHAQSGADGLVFVGAKGSPSRRGNFDKMVRWRDVVANAGMPGLRFHDLHHTGNTLVAPHASTRELMSRMGHSSTRAAIVYQHTQPRSATASSPTRSTPCSWATFPLWGTVQGQTQRARNGHAPT